MKKIVTFITFSLSFLSYTNTIHAFMDLNYVDISGAYVDANIDTIKIVLDQHANRSEGRYNSTKCFQQISFFKTEIRDFKLWALKVIDSWSKPPSGLASGNIRGIGNFDQCLGIEQDSNNTDIGTFRGQFCVTPITVIVNDENIIIQNLKKFTSMSSKVISSVSGIPTAYMGSCIPESCSPDAWRDIINFLINKYHFKIGNNLERLCQSAEKPPFNQNEKIALIFFSTIIVLMVLSTIYEICLTTKKPEISTDNILTIFSVYSNGNSIFQLSKRTSSNHIECLNGLRTFTILWIVLGHSYVVSLYQPMINTLALLKWIKTPFASLMFHAPYACDTFLLIGGFVLGWHLLNRLNRQNGKVSFTQMIFVRYLRLTPPLMAVIFFQMTLFRRLGTGPLWYDIIAQREDFCRENWWKTLTYLQNYMGNHICVPESWYLAVDFQLFCVSIFLIFGIWKWANHFIWTLLLPILVSCIYTFYVIYSNDYRLTSLNGENAWQFMNDTYFATQTRLTPYFIGILLAYFIYKNRDRKLYIKRSSVTFGWVISNMVFWIGYLAIYDMVHIQSNDALLKSAIYQTFLRILWSLNIAWILFACHYHRAGFINTFLSFRIWQPFSRLSFNIYIIHMNVQVYFAARSQTHFYFNDFFMINRAIGDLGFTLIVATIWALAFEYPTVRLLNIMFKPKSGVDDRQLDERNQGAEEKNQIHLEKFTYFNK